MTRIDKIKFYAEHLESNPVEVYVLVLTHLRTIGSISKYVWDTYYARFYSDPVILNEVIAGLEQKRFKIKHDTKHYKGKKGLRVVNYTLFEDIDWSIIKRPLTSRTDINGLP